MGSNTTYDIPVVASGTNAPSVSLVNDDADGRTFEFVSTVVSDRVDIYASADGVAFPPIVNTTPLFSLGGNSPPKTIVDRSLKYRAVFTGTGVRTLKVRAGTGCCAGDAGQHFNTLALPDFPVNSVIGTAAATVDQFAAFTFAQTTAFVELTFPAPTDPTATYVRWVSNIGSQAFILYGLLVLPGAGTKLVWNGSAWFNGCTGTASPTRTVLAAAGIDILDSNGSTTALGNTEIGVPGNSLQLAAGAGGGQWAVTGAGVLDLQTAAGALGIDTTGGAINIGTGATAKTISVGNLIGATGIGMQTGTAGWAVQTATTGPIAMSTGTTGTVTIDSGTTGAINIGTGANGKTITVGNLAGATAVILRSSSALQLEVAAAGTLSLGSNATQHDVNIGSNVGTSSVAIVGGTGGVGVGSNAIAQTVTIGNIVGASAVNILAGTAGVSIQPAATGPLTAKSGTSGDATFDSGTTGAVHIGDGANQKAVTVGSVTLAASLALRAGTGGLTIVNNGATWTWPTALGAAGTKLTDAAGNGLLTWT